MIAKYGEIAWIIVKHCEISLMIEKYGEISWIIAKHGEIP